MAHPSISVLLPVYNAAATLDACLESIRAQTLGDFEVVLVDDGSTDETPCIAARHAAVDPRIRVERMAHGGIIRALNHGLARCRGPYVARMDGDDRMHPQRLARQLDFHQTQPTGSLTGAQVRLFRPGGEPSAAGLRYIAWQNSLLDDAAIQRELYVEAPISHPTFFAERELFTRLGGYRDTGWAEDYDLLFRAARAGVPLAKLPAVLVDKGDGPQRLTRTDRIYRRSAMFRAKAHHFREVFAASGHARLIICGSGPSGRLVLKAFRAEGVEPHGIVDNMAGPPGRTVAGLPASGFPGVIQAEQLAGFDDALFVLCIGDPVGRGQFVAALESLGRREPHDFVRFI
jgi:glycosyltransferase involved in cell wall biosynthesis